MKAQMPVPDVIVPPRPPVPVPPVLPPEPPERDDPTEPDGDPDWSDDELPPAVNRTPGHARDRIDAILTSTWGNFGTRLAAAEARLSMLTWLACCNLVVTLLMLGYLSRCNTVHFAIRTAELKSIQVVGCGVRGRNG